MTSIREQRARAARALAVGLALAACSERVESPTPALDPPSAEAEPPPVDPEIVCAEQRSSRVTVHGARFSPVPIDVPGAPKLALPSVVLTRAHELDGASVAEPERVIYSGDYHADPTNALDDDGQLIEVGGEPLLRWESQEELSFAITQELVLGERTSGEDERERGALPPGVWDVAVRNPGGQRAESLGALAVVAAPRLEALAPELVCLAQGPRTIVVRGQSLLRSEAERVELAVEGVDERFGAELSDCAGVAHEGLDAEVCETATIELAEGAIPPGYPQLTLVNPASAACSSEQEVALRVVAAPSIDRIVEPLACIAQGARSFTIEGEGFLRVDERAVPEVMVGELEVTIDGMECEAIALPAGSRSVELCTSLTFTLEGDDLQPGLYDVSVMNPDGGEGEGCRAVSPGALRIAAPPAIDGLEPSYACLDGGAREVTITGQDFLVVGGVAPLVEIGGEALEPAAVAAAGCDAATLDVGELEVLRCSGLVATLPASEVSELASPEVRVVNPQPAGCSELARDALTLLPRPVLASALPSPICNEQGADTVVLTGSGFLEVAGQPPEVSIGGVTAEVATTDATCEAIEGREGAFVCSELVVTLAEGALAAGVHDIVVTHEASGCATSDAIALAVVDAPEITAVEPNPICLARGGVTVTLRGAGFVRVGTEQPSVTFGDGGAAVAAAAVAVTEASCAPIDGAASAVRCTELTATLAMSALPEGTAHRVTVTNPGAAACASEEPIELTVAAPPDIASIDTALVCTGGGAIAIAGTNLAGIRGRLVDPDTGGVVESIHTVVGEDGMSATITFGAGVSPDTYELQISAGGGCDDVATQVVNVSIGPVAFFMDPPVAYNGVALRGTLYASGVPVAPLGVILTPQGGGSAGDQELLEDVAWPAGNANEIGATLPAGLGEGVYDVTVDFPGSCDTVLPGGLTVEGDLTLALGDPALTPRFGEQLTARAVSALAKAESELASGEVNFAATPRAYLSSAALATAEPLRAIQLDSEERLTAIVPGTLAPGSYDLVVVNPDGAVGFRAGAYQATAVAPPVIDAVEPTQLDNDMDRPITIHGGNFVNPTSDMAVTLECVAPGATQPATVGPLAIDGASTAIELIATAPSSTLSHGTICAVRVTNATNATFDELSAITITNPASKLPPFQSGTALVEARRAPALAFGTATREARFLYAIGGDDGDPTQAKASVEAAVIGRFGVLGRWRTLPTELPAGITLAQAISGGRYVYVFGGASAGGASTPTAAIHRAAVLRPEDAPEITGVELRFFGGAVDGDPDTREGLAQGALTYLIAAVFDETDADNPGGESLPSEPLTLYAPDVPDGVEVELSWPAVLGADGVTEAASYRIYRTVAPDGPLDSLALLAEVAAPQHSYVDRNPAVFLDPEATPRVIGDLGEWRELPAVLNTPRAAYGLALARDPSCALYAYVVGGRTDGASESATYERASFDPSTGALGAFTEAAATGLDARREHALLVADGASSAFINPAPGACQSYVYASSGFSGGSAFVTSIQDAPVQAGGALGAFTTALSSGSSPQLFAGHAGFFSSDGAYVLGGAASTASPPAATSAAQQATLNGSSVPNLGNFSSASSVLLQARYLPGFARQGAFFYLVGGADSAGAPLRSTERNVR